MQIAIDGPASAGKSTIAKLLAKQLRYVYLDTGAMYRAVTWWALKNHLPLNDEKAILQSLGHEPIVFVPAADGQHVRLFDTDITTAIRSEDVTNNVSQVSALPGVRAEMTKRQREIAAGQDIVMDGRDIGTTVLPHADVKIFMVASVAERAKRRFKDNAEKGIHVPEETLAKEIAARDYKDSHRAESPLKKAADAVTIDTTHLTIPQVVAAIVTEIEKKRPTRAK
ncbi:(d)CMP kinase [Schleiferilactobacillus shenzhenensis]|uniref:(d)CMP kinase n=1 Tax=Schleiferilactobacillus shenzhenensis TaxID=1231337 RepID=UPI000590DDD2|nr:(d)CMP kinase [Schleiferilactobacillus shenzhenensis]